MRKVILYTIIVLSTALSGCVYEDEDWEGHHGGREWWEERHEEHEEHERHRIDLQQPEQYEIQQENVYLI